MKIEVTLQGIGAYSQSRLFAREKNEGESDDKYEERSWKQHAHFKDQKRLGGNVIVPAFALKCMLDEAAAYIGEKVPGDGKRTFSSIFRCGVIVAEDPVLLVNGKPVTEKDLVPEWIPANADGKRGSGKRVPRCYPIFHDWSITPVFEALDPRITEEIFLKHLWAAGIYKGIGRYRAGNGGCHGRFDVLFEGKKFVPKSMKINPPEPKKARKGKSDEDDGGEE